MAKRISIFLLALLLVGLVCYLFYLNPDTVGVRYSSANSWEAPLAVIVISFFFAGAAFVGIIGVYLSTKRSLHDWFERRKDRRKRVHEQLLLEGRSELAVKNFDAAREKFRRVTNEDEKNTLGWLLLADATEEARGVAEALKILDQARRSNSSNLELLFRAADINEKLMNITAAYDNLNLVLQTQPDNTAALKKLVIFAERLGRIDEGIEFCRTLMRFVSHEEREALQNKLASLEVRAAAKKFAKDHAALRKELDAVLRRHRDFAPAFGEMARIEREANNLPAASRLWARAFQHSDNTEYLDQISSMWLDIDNPEQAITAVKNAVVSRKNTSVRGRLYLAHLYLSLEMLEEARSELSSLSSEQLSGQQKLFAAFLEAKLDNRSGKAEQAYQRLMQLIEASELLPDYVGCIDRRAVNGQRKIIWKGRRTPRLEAPPPRLSTP